MKKTLALLVMLVAACGDTGGTIIIETFEDAGADADGAGGEGGGPPHACGDRDAASGCEEP